MAIFANVKRLKIDFCRIMRREILKYGHFRQNQTFQIGVSKGTFLNSVSSSASPCTHFESHGFEVAAATDSL